MNGVYGKRNYAWGAYKEPKVWLSQKRHGFFLKTPCTTLEHWLEILQVDVAQLVQPEAVERGGGLGKVVLVHPVVAELDGLRQPRQDPPVHRRQGGRTGRGQAGRGGRRQRRPLGGRHGVEPVVPAGEVRRGEVVRLGGQAGEDGGVGRGGGRPAGQPPDRAEARVELLEAGGAGGRKS